MSALSSKYQNIISFIYSFQSYSLARFKINQLLHTAVKIAFREAHSHWYVYDFTL